MDPVLSADVQAHIKTAIENKTLPFLEDSPFGAMIFTMCGQLRWCNKRFTSLFGYTAVDVVERKLNLNDFCLMSDVFKQACLESVSTFGSYGWITANYQHKEGYLVTASSKGRSIDINNNEYIVSAYDIYCPD